MPWAPTKGITDYADPFGDELVAEVSATEEANCFFPVAKKVRVKAPMLRSSYKPVIGGFCQVYQLRSTTVHQQKKRDMLGEWSTMGVSEQLVYAFKKEYIGTSWCAATLPAGF